MRPAPWDRVSVVIMLVLLALAAAEILFDLPVLVAWSLVGVQVVLAVIWFARLRAPRRTRGRAP